MSTDAVSPAAPAHDRGRECAQALCGHAERPYQQLQAVNPHLRLADVALLAAYAQAMTKTYRLARQSDPASVSSWEKSARMAMSLATKLRVTAQSQVHPETAGRKRQQLPPSYYDVMGDADE